MNAPRATYRLQLRPGFGFVDAAGVVPYLARLGVSHVYTSPILQAEAGSTHGYDVVDHSRLNEELGGESGFAALVAAVRRHKMGLVVDIVPNHMAIGPANGWWWDVLEHGPASRFASYFDVYWDSPRDPPRNVILLPVLADHYRHVLEAGELRLHREGASVTVQHADRRFPIEPRSLGAVLSEGARRSRSDELAVVARAFEALPPATGISQAAARRRRRDAVMLAERLAVLLAGPEVAAAVDAALAAISADHDRLDAFLGEQHYRLDFRSAASRDLGYRRFFDIDTLVGLRVEREEVFEATHRVVLERVTAGEVAGLRVDHPDGLRDPAGYFERLRDAAPDAWIVAEKILAPDEALRPWPIDGTTGYGFANLVTRVQTEPSAEAPLTELYAAHAGDAGWEEVATAARLAALGGSLGGDLHRLTDLWLSICAADRRYRGYTRHDLHDAMREVVAAFDVYRTYVRATPRTVSDEDRRVVRDATRLARERRPDLAPDLFDSLSAILLLEVPGEQPAELAMRFQQFTPAAMAKGVEDTAFYRYGRLVALNEVGGEPGVFSVDPRAFHAALRAGGRRLPRAMLASSTHDTKRSEDVRARLVAISEDPPVWRDSIELLVRLAAPHRTDDDTPSPQDEYVMLQALVGAWPIDADRAWAYLCKAAREAKERTAWTAPDASYEAALERLVRGCLADEGFVAELQASVDSLLVAGRLNALAGMLWKLAAPGVPDIYQGTELWSLSLVDPDNRRPVDFARRARLLDGGAPTAAIADDHEGTHKLWLARQALELRARRPGDLDGGARYEPLVARGPAADHVIGFVRGEGVAAVAPRLVRRLAASGGWRDTTLALPAGRWHDVLDDRELDGAELHVADLLDGPRVALLERVA